VIKAVVIGATGYAGSELVRILARHPLVELVALTSTSAAGRPLTDFYPQLHGLGELVLTSGENAQLPEAEVYFLSLPHGESASLVRQIACPGRVIIDLGADFRLRQEETYRQWYGAHGAAELLSGSVYGLPELHRPEILTGDLIANPGCYPTSAILPLAPLLSYGLIDPSSIIIDAKSGVSGAGRALKESSHFVEVNENINPYSVGSHRHTPEIEQELSLMAGEKVTVSFTPHLVPMTRGILSTIYAGAASGTTEEKLREACREFYAISPFVRLLEPGQWPHTRWVTGSNNCWFNLVLDRRTGRVVIASVIDNLVKGAAGQAVQNMNLRLGLAEVTGLEPYTLNP